MEVGRPDWAHVSPTHGGRIDEILRRVADGETVKAICSDDDMPAAQDVAKWAREHEDFRAAYYTAHKLSVPAIIDRAIDIADDDSGDEYTDAKGIKRIDSGRVQRDRLRVEARFKAVGHKVGAIRAGAFDATAEHPLIRFIRMYAELTEDEREGFRGLEGEELARAYARLLGPGD